MKLQNRLKSYTVVLLLSPLLFLGSLNGETGRKSVKELFIVQKILEKMEECYVEIKETNEVVQIERPQNSGCVLLYEEHKFASEKRGMPKLR